MDGGTLNVLMMGLAFLLLFTSWQTLSNIEATLLASASDPSSMGYVSGFSGSAFTSLALVYVASSMFNWLAPSIIAHLGVRLSLVMAALPYTLFVAQLLQPTAWLLYTCSFVLGMGAACLWTAQGVYLTLNSNSTNLERNTGLFWAMFQCSLLLGNTFVFFMFFGSEDIDTRTRNVTLAALIGVALAGNAVLLTLRAPTETRSSESISPTLALQRAGQLALRPEMLKLYFSFVYLGLVLTFWSGVYGPCLGFTLAFGTTVSKSLVGVHGIVVGLGEILGGLLALFKYTLSMNMALIMHLVAFLVIFVNLPNDAPFGDTETPAYIPSNAILAALCSLLLGLGDAAFNTNVMAILGKMYKENSAPAFAIFKFAQSLAAAISFYYSNHFVLSIQLIILTLCGILALKGFNSVAKSVQAQSNNEGNQANVYEGFN